MTHQSSGTEVLLFWFGPAAEWGKPHKRWFTKSDAFDREVRERFLPLHEDAAAGRLSHLRESAADCLALILLLDQFPRNMFRGTPRAFATDPLALETARQAVDRGFDRGLLPQQPRLRHQPGWPQTAIDYSTTAWWFAAVPQISISLFSFCSLVPAGWTWTWRPSGQTQD